MSRYTNIQCRNGFYYFRMAVPMHLRHRMGCHEFTYSLRTKCVHEAKVRCYYLTNIAYQIFKMVEGMAKLTTAQVKEISRTYFKECLKRFREYEESHEENRMGLPSSVYEEHENGITVEQAVADIVAPFSNDKVNVETGAYLFRMTDHVLESNGMEVNEESRSYKALAREGLEKVQNEFRSLIEQHANYKLEYEIRNKEWFGDLLGESVAVPQPQQMVTIEDTSELISVVHERYMGEAQASRVSEDTLKKKKAKCLVWLELFTDRNIQSFTKEDGRRFKAVVRGLPAKSAQRYPDKNLQELVELNDPRKRSVKTINDYLGEMGTFFRWAIRNGYYEGANPLDGLKMSQRSNAINERKPFSPEQLKKLFSSPLYKGCKSTGRRFEKGEHVFKDAKYWVPLVALYSGMRLQEICQLDVSDIKQDQDVWVFDVNVDGSLKKLKNQSSIRLIPVHDVLQRAGFLTYVDELRSRGESRVFPDVGLASDNTYSKTFSKQFTTIAERTCIKTPKTCFHSFRHNFEDCLKNEDGIKELTRDALTGHSNRSMASRYGSAIRTPKLKEAG